MSLYFFYQQFRDHAANMFEGVLIEGEDSDGYWDIDEVAEANAMDVDFFNSVDDEEGVTVLDNPNGPGVESGDEATDDDAWVWKSKNP